MLLTWWYEVDLLFEFHFEGMGEPRPRGLEKKVLNKLLALTLGEPVLVMPSADKLVQATRLRWHAPGSTQAHDLLQMSIERVGIRMLVDFCVLLPEYHETLSFFDELMNFQITGFGKRLLDAIQKS